MTDKESTFDLSSLDTQGPAEVGTIVHLENPFKDDELLYHDKAQTRPFFIKVVGSDSERVRSFEKKHENRIYERIGKRKSAELDADKVFAERIGKAAVATVEWDVWPLDGEVLTCTEGNARRLYGDKRFRWILEQVEAAMRDRSRFLQNSATG